MQFVCIDDQELTTLICRSNIELLGIYSQECISPGSNVKLLRNYEQEHMICYLFFIMSGLPFYLILVFYMCQCSNLKLVSLNKYM